MQILTYRFLANVSIFHYVASPNKFNNKASVEFMVLNATLLAEREFDRIHPLRGFIEWVWDIKK